MTNFIDTNVAVGYTVIHDKWHNYSKDFINDNSSIFWSTFVKEEYQDTLDDIIDDMGDFLDKTTYLLEKNQSDFTNFSDFENFVLKNTRKCELDRHKKQKILEEFWHTNQFTYAISKVISIKFNEFIGTFQKPYAERDTKLKGHLTLHDCGLDNYKKYLNYAEYLRSHEIHKPDYKIITDAHDCGLKHGNLTFILSSERIP